MIPCRLLRRCIPQILLYQREVLEKINRAAVLIHEWGEPEFDSFD